MRVSKLQVHISTCVNLTDRVVTVCFNLYEGHKQTNCSKAEKGRIVVVFQWGKLAERGHRGPPGGVEMFHTLILTVVMWAFLYIKIHPVAHLRCVC